MSPGRPETEVQIRGRVGANVAPLARAASDWLKLAGSPLGLTSAHELSVVLCDRPSIRALNRQWRSRDVPTDVLSFPQHELKPGKPAPPGPLGDIVLAVAQARQDARLSEIDFDRHFRHLLLHGLLHLLGYDHQTDAQAAEMESLESEILDKLCKT